MRPSGQSAEIDIAAEVRQGWVAVHGVRFHHLYAGSGPALILVHGLIGSARNWDPLVAELARIRTVYALDLANMGESERNPLLEAGLEGAARHLEAWMDAQGIAVADIAGHSHGGAIVMMLAALHPERVRRIVLFAPANPLCRVGDPLIRFYNTPVGTWLARWIPKMPKAIHHWAHKRMYADPGKATPQALEGYTSGLNPESIEHVLRILRAWQQDMALLEQRLPEVAKTPALLLWGEQDGAVSVASGRRLSQALGARLITFDSVGHIPFAERPEECRRAMREWLEG